jgi:DNA-binding MarR family transcriptional regulator
MREGAKAKRNASELTKHIGFWMRRVSNHVSSSFARKLAGHNVTVAEWVVLREMYPHDDTTSPCAVAEFTGLTRSAVSKLLNRLLDKGLATRKESVTDRRYQDIELTRTAVELVPRMARLADENDDEVFSVLSQAERSTLMRILMKVVSSHNLTQVPIE